MRYAAYVHAGDQDHAFGAIVPDFPGCFAAADNERDLTDAVQEAVELYCADEDMDIPEPSKLGDLMKDEQYQEGAWVLVDVDTRKINTKVKRYNVSLPEALVMEVDEKRGAQSRSSFLATAAREKLDRLKDLV